MTSQKQHEFTIPVEDFDTAVLPEDARTPGTSRFKEAVSDYLTEDFENFSGRARITVDDEKISIIWTTEKEWPELLNEAVAKLQNGDYAGGVVLLKLLRAKTPDDPDILYNLGMALSDMGELEKAEQYLDYLVKLEPDHINARVALGVALQRQDKNKEAIAVLQKATRKDPDNPWAHRNLGAALLDAGDTAEGEKHIRRSAEINPRDQQAWYGLGQALEAQDKTKEADNAYKKSIEINPHSDIAEMAREARGRFAQESFRERGASAGGRFDAVMYCLGAMQRFDQMSKSKMHEIVMEIALKGRSGLDINDPDSEYTLRSLPGKFTGLQLVSMMYVGFKRIAPEQDVGIDLSKEYEQAQQLYREKSEG